MSATVLASRAHLRHQPPRNARTRPSGPSAPPAAQSTRALTAASFPSISNCDLVVVPHAHWVVVGILRASKTNLVSKFAPQMWLPGVDHPIGTDLNCGSQRLEVDAVLVVGIKTSVVSIGIYPFHGFP